MSPTPGTPTARSTRSIIATSPVWLLGVLAAVAAAIVTELFALSARAIGVPMEAGSLGGWCFLRKVTKRTDDQCFYQCVSR